MALVTRVSDASVDGSTAVQAAVLAGDLIAGENLDPVSPCKVESDGLVYMSNGTADDADAHVHGFNNRQVNAGEPVTLYPPDTRFRYGSGLTPGATLYLGATDGRLDDGATTGDSEGIAFVIDETDIVFTRRII